MTEVTHVSSVPSLDATLKEICDVETRLRQLSVCAKEHISDVAGHTVLYNRKVYRWLCGRKTEYSEVVDSLHAIQDSLAQVDTDLADIAALVERARSLARDAAARVDEVALSHEELRDANQTYRHNLALGRV